jgi:thiamine-phosphate diphosphorylase
MTLPRIIAITPADLDLASLRALLGPLFGLVDAIHLRWPQLSAREIVRRASALAEMEPRPRLLLNDRADLAVAAGVEGVHLRDDGIPPAALPPRLRLPLVGVSRHDAAGVRMVEAADYVVVSPVAATPSKLQAKPLGRAGLRALVDACSRPVLALGGIEPDDISWVLHSGAAGIVVLRGILGAEDPLERARAYRRAFSAARNDP